MVREELDLEKNELKLANDMLNTQIEGLKLKLTNEENRRADEIALLKELKSQEISDLETQLAQKSEALKEMEQKLHELKSRSGNQDARFLELEEKLIESAKALADAEDHAKQQVDTNIELEKVNKELKHLLADLNQ